jgi:hypothetical protein
MMALPLQIDVPAMHTSSSQLPVEQWYGSGQSV